MANVDLNYSYISEKFADARRSLMLPANDAEAIACALHECSLGLDWFEVEKVDAEYARDYIKKLKTLMDTSDIEPVGEQGTWRQKIEAFGGDERLELVKIIDELASYFCMKFWEGK